MTGLAITGGPPVRRAAWPLPSMVCPTEELRAELDRVLAGEGLSQFTSGRVHELEHALAQRFSRRHAVAVSSGTLALETALHALGIGPGDEVVVPAATYISTASSVNRVGARPVFVDCDDTLTLAPDRVRAALAAHTKALVFVSLFGNPGNLNEIADLCRQAGVPLVHDCAQGAASTLDGGWIAGRGDLTTLSFFETKHIAAGEGGALLTDSAEWFLRAKAFANLHETLPDGTPTGVRADFGRLPRYRETGVNGRLPVLSAVLAGHALRRLPDTLAHCAAVGAHYRAALADLLTFPLVPAGAQVGWYGVPGRMAVPGLRDGLWRAVLAEGVGIARYYYTVLPDNEAFRTGRRGPGGVPVTRATDRETVILPTHLRIGPQERDDVVSAVRKVCAALRAPRQGRPELVATSSEQR